MLQTARKPIEQKKKILKSLLIAEMPAIVNMKSCVLMFNPVLQSKNTTRDDCMVQTQGLLAGLSSFICNQKRGCIIYSAFSLKPLHQHYSTMQFCLTVRHLLHRNDTHTKKSQIHQWSNYLFIILTCGNPNDSIVKILTQLMTLLGVQEIAYQWFSYACCETQTIL